MKTFLDCQNRYQILKGDPDSACDDTGKSHINSAVFDILKQYPFSWNLATTTLTLSAGTASLPANYTPDFGIETAAITGSLQGDDYTFNQIPVSNRDAYGSSDYVYWITYDTSTNRYIFNSPTLTGTVTIYYHFEPTDMSADGDFCVVPDYEAVAYLAASKNWIGDERNQGLANDYDVEAQKRIRAMYQHDLMFSDLQTENSLAGNNLYRRR